MENNIKVFRVHRALSWLYGLLFVLMLTTSMKMVTDGNPVGPMIGVLTFIGLIFTAHHYVAKGARQRKNWAKGGSALIAVFMLLGFPIGTIIGIYLLVNNSGWESEAH